MAAIIRRFSKGALRMRFYVGVLGAALLGILLSGCANRSNTYPTDIESTATATAGEWKNIKATVHEVSSTYRPWDAEASGKVLKQVHVKTCAGGLPSYGNTQGLINTLKFKAFALGATGITGIEVHIVPWKSAPPAGHPCVSGYMEATALALVLDKGKFPNLFPEYRRDSTPRTSH
ncbi:MAG: hypothetical protein MUW57_28485 [Pseudomonas sp.]|nr:hypothetical protein [Pseudomonas sp.]